MRGLAVVYLVAFTSLLRQVRGLYGKKGILPLQPRLDRVRESLGRERYWRLPSVFWLSASDGSLERACQLGRALSIGLFCGILPRLALAGLGVLYLSLVSVGADFLAFQWDALLLETTLHGLFVARPGEPTRGAIWLMRWLVFRLYLESGLGKWRSGDLSWRKLTAMSTYYETAPLPTRFGWHAHHLPARTHVASTGVSLGLEIAAAVMSVLPRPFRSAGYDLLEGMQGAISATGNYGFFNSLSDLLALWLLDDDLLSTRGRPRRVRRGPSGAREWVEGVLAGAIAAWTAIDVGLWVLRRSPPEWKLRVDAELGHLRVLNRYGLFTVMTGWRPEIILEGSDDGQDWRPYEFRFKPGGPRRPPLRVAPHQPRLDWQMWFAALGSPPPWFAQLIGRLLQGSPEVLALFGDNPFPDHPPRYVRALLYEYRMTDEKTRGETGRWWDRKLLGRYFPTVTLESS